MAAQLCTVGLAVKWSRIPLRARELTVLPIESSREAKTMAYYELPVLFNWVLCTSIGMIVVAESSCLGSRNTAIKWSWCGAIKDIGLTPVLFLLLKEFAGLSVHNIVLSSDSADHQSFFQFSPFTSMTF